MVAALHEQNARTKEQFGRTGVVADRLWELWDGEAAILLGAEWELADGRARALLDEELALLALLPQLPPFPTDEAQDAPSLGREAERQEPEAPPASPASEGQRRGSPSGTTGQDWAEAELFELMEHAAAHFHAQEQEFSAALATREELIEQVELHACQNGSAYASEHRLWLLRAQDVVTRLVSLSEGVRAAREAYLKASRTNTQMFRADLFSEAKEPPPAAGNGREFYGQLSPEGLYALADLFGAATEQLLKALIATELGLEKLGPLAAVRQQAEAAQYDRHSQAVFLLAGDCLAALGLLTRSVRQAARNWEVTEFNAGRGRGVLPEAVTVKEVVEMRIAPPPSAQTADKGRANRAKPEPSASKRAAELWRTLAEKVDALETAISATAARLYAVQDGALEVADLCECLHAQSLRPWWRRGSSRFGP